MTAPQGAELLSVTAVRELLARHGLSPRRAAGQNFLVDPNWVRKIVRDAHVLSDEVVVEIGPGLGSLTLALAAAAREVIAVEIDAGLVDVLRSVVGESANVTVVHADALRIDLDQLVRSAGHDRVRLVANLPYNVATPLVFTALASETVTDQFVMVQREVGERWAARPGHELYGGVSAKLALLADVEVVAAVPRTVFFPPPRVDSVTVRLTPRGDAPAGYGDVAALIDAAFTHRRKTVRNNLRRITDEAAVADALDVAGIDPGARPEELHPDDFVRLARALGRTRPGS